MANMICDCHVDDDVGDDLMSDMGYSWLCHISGRLVDVGFKFMG